MSNLILKNAEIRSQYLSVKKLRAFARGFFKEKAILEDLMFSVLKHIWPFLHALPSVASWRFHVNNVVFRRKNRPKIPSRDPHDVDYSHTTRIINLANILKSDWLFFGF